MNVWFRDPRFKEAEAKAIAADHAERRGQRDLAMALNHEAGEGFAAVAVCVPADHPNTRSDLAISAVVCFGLADRYDRAIQFARQMLARQGMLSPRGRGELMKLLSEYEPLAPRDRLPAKRAVPNRMRAAVREAA
jgi:hypothetical protein